jgi:hypothetical protein
MIKLTYKYSKKDKVHEYGIESEPDDIWLYFYLGALIGNKGKISNNTEIFPYDVGNGILLGKYRSRDSEINAKNIYKRITNHRRDYKNTEA